MSINSKKMPINEIYAFIGAQKDIFTHIKEMTINEIYAFIVAPRDLFTKEYLEKNNQETIIRDWFDVGSEIKVEEMGYYHISDWRYWTAIVMFDRAVNKVVSAKSAVLPKKETLA